MFRLQIRAELASEQDIPHGAHAKGGNDLLARPPVQVHSLGMFRASEKAHKSVALLLEHTRPNQLK
jgi:hypothetical protein